MATVLIIEDDPTYRQLLRTIIESHGYDVWEASNGQEGIMLCRLLLPDLVITDIFMAVKDGLETIADLHALFVLPKVIAMSAHRDKLELALDLGAQEVFQKPIDPQELLDTVKEVLRF